MGKKRTLTIPMSEKMIVQDMSVHHVCMNVNNEIENHRELQLKNPNLPCLHESDLMTKIVADRIIHASTLDFFFAVLGLADSAGPGEPGGSVGGLGAFSTSGSGSEEPLDTPENKIKYHHSRLKVI